MTRAVVELRRQRRRVLAQQCSGCRRHWALQLVDHPTGFVVRCRYCELAVLRTWSRGQLSLVPDATAG